MKKYLLPLFLLPLSLFAQSEELKQRTNLFLNELSDRFENKSLNAKEPSYGALNNSDFSFHQYIQIKQIEKEVNSIGNKVRPKYDLSTFHFENPEELKYALVAWFKDFFGEKITVGRTYRTFDHAVPTIVVIESDYIAILTLSCYSVDDYEFREWRKDMVEVFGSPESIVIELGCDGPLEWTKNAPDPKDKSWR